jgi:hypothetical protein
MLSRLRLWCFRLSVLTIALGSPAVMLALAHPFPLIADGQGGYSNSRNFWAVTASLFLSALSFLFSIFSNRWRGRLILSSIALILLSYLSLFTDGH